MPMRMTKLAKYAQIGEVFIMPNGAGRVIERIERRGNDVHFAFLYSVRPLNDMVLVVGASDPVTVEVEESRQWAA